MAFVATLAKLSMMVGLALTLSTSAGAVVSVGLEQVGGTYDPTVGAHAGETLVLNITYSFEPGDVVVLIDPTLVFSADVASFDAAASTEAGPAVWGGVGFGSIATGDIRLVSPSWTSGREKAASGWEKAAYPGTAVSGTCVFGACTSLGTAYFVLSGNSGTIAVGGAGKTVGTVIGDGTWTDVSSISHLGAFQIISNPEPSTALLLAFGLIGIAAGRRRRAAVR